jgi:2-polyprenyl-3-methyl-5-hydroxy-6-metoxy-1,4-benzoquinol methylase
LQEDLHLAYRNYYTHEERRGFLGRICYDAFAVAYRAVNSVPSFLVGLRGPRRKIRSMFLDDLPPGRLFDVGCGDGAFLHRMIQQGWTGGGIDFDEAAVRAAKDKFGLSLLSGDFQTVDISERDYDAVTMSHVIEHVVDPVETLAKCRAILRPGGRLVVTTPNALGLGHQRFTRNWRGLEPPRHLQIFRPRTLAECAGHAGFQVISSGSTAANADYLIAASHSIASAPEDERALGGGWKLRSALHGVAFQYREQKALRKDPEAGEECVLICLNPFQ